MNAPFDPKRVINPFSPAPQLTLAAVITKLMDGSLGATRQRDLTSAVYTIAKLLRAELSTLPADIGYLRERIDALNPTAVDFKPRPVSPKTWSNVRSNFFAALEAAGVTVLRTGKLPRTAAWRQFFAGMPRRYRDGLSRLSGFCSVNAIEPPEVNDAVMRAFGNALRAGSFVNANTIQKDTVTLWNRLVDARPEQSLTRLTPPNFRKPPRRLSLDEFPESFRKDVHDHLAWAALEDPFAADARNRPLREGSIRLRYQQILTAVTALVKAGTSRDEITSLACLVTVPAFTAIISERLHKHAGKPNASEHRLAQALVAIAREWVKVRHDELAELKRLFRRVPAPRPGLTAKNKALLARLDDPDALAALIALPAQLVAEAERASLSQRSLATAHAGVAICIGVYAALRPANLASLKIGETLLLGSRDDRESVIELPAEVVKNGDPFATVLPPEATGLLRRYCNQILRPVFRREPTYLFDNGKGRPKLPQTLTWLVQRTTKRRLGFPIALHQFRHINAKILLDANPGGYESVRQFLGHKNMTITTNFYAGFNPGRAARLHAELLRKLRVDESGLSVCSKSGHRTSRGKRAKLQR